MDKQVLQPNEEGALLLLADTARFVGPKTVTIYLTLLQGKEETTHRFTVKLESVKVIPPPRLDIETGSEGGAALKAPAEDTSGIVRKTDTNVNLVTISIGTDAGIRAGQILELFRLQPKPEYLGMIQIVIAHDREAVAKPVPPLSAKRIVAGDRVANRVVEEKPKREQNFSFWLGHIW